MKELLEACKVYFADGGSEAVDSIETLERHADHANVRVSFKDETVSDWNLSLDEDGTVLDGWCYNEVI